MKTKVIFRVWKDNNDVIALFPEEPAVVQDWYLCSSYMHVGQHSAAHYFKVLQQTRLAKPEEYQELKTELERLGYDLKVYKRETSQMRQNRYIEYKRIMSL